MGGCVADGIPVGQHALRWRARPGARRARHAACFTGKSSHGSGRCGASRDASAKSGQYASTVPIPPCRTYPYPLSEKADHAQTTNPDSAGHRSHRRHRHVDGPLVSPSATHQADGARNARACPGSVLPSRLDQATCPRQRRGTRRNDPVKNVKRERWAGALVIPALPSALRASRNPRRCCA